MKHYHLLIAFTLPLLTACESLPDFTVATWNIRVSRQDDTEITSWENRRDTVFNLIHTVDPDVLGLQEVMPNQLDDIRLEFGEEYDTRYTITHPDGECLLTLVKRDKFYIADSTGGYHRIDTGPYVSALSRTRVCQDTIECFTFWNGHTYGSEEVLTQVRHQVSRPNAVVVGDFNALPGPNPYAPYYAPLLLQDGLVDTYAEAHPDVDSREKSSCDWHSCAESPGLQGFDARVDYILRSPELTTQASEIEEAYVPAGTNASDHWLQWTRLEM